MQRGRQGDHPPRRDVAVGKGEHHPEQQGDQAKRRIADKQPFGEHAIDARIRPLDDGDRVDLLRDELGLGLCNITKCCTEVCPEHIKITDNAIIPLKERVVDRFYDPLTRLLRVFKG